MRKLLPAVIAVVLISIQVRAQDAGAVIDAAMKAMGTAGLDAIQYSGTGTNNSAGQAPSPGGPWPRFRLTKYLASIDYAIPAMRQEVVRIDNEYPPRGGGAGPFNAATGQGGIRPIPGDIIQNQTIDGRTEGGALTIYLTPHGFLKGAAANAATARVTRARGRTLVAFTTLGKYTVTGTLDGRNLVERVETTIYNNFTGDTPVEGAYSAYRDFGGVQFPTRIVMRQGGHPMLELTVGDVQPHTAAALRAVGVPQRGGGQGPAGAPGGAPAGGAAAGPQITPEPIADGLWFLTSGAPQSILVEFSNHLVIIEAPSNDARTMATIAEARRMHPDKPIRYVVNTHHHSDHSGGLRAYVAEGITVITHEAHRRYYEQQIFRNPHSLNPDRLARAPRAPRIETVRDRRVLTDGTMTLELHHLRNHPHSDGLLMAYVPGARLVIQADAFAPRPGAAPLPKPSPYTIHLVDAIERLKLDVERVVHVHGGSDPIAVVRQAAGKSPGL